MVSLLEAVHEPLPPLLILPQLAPQAPTRYTLEKNIPKKGPLNRRSLGCARDDKGEDSASMESGCCTGTVLIKFGWPMTPLVWMTNW
jgi:hypothetical protein